MNITPEILREAQTYLWDGRSFFTGYVPASSGTIGICQALHRACNDPSINGINITDWFYDQGWIQNMGYLPFPNSCSWEEKQAVRFMLMELMALMLEDGAL